MKVQLRLWVGFGVTMAFLVLVSILANYETKRISQSEQWVKHTQEVISNIEKLLSNLKDAETGQRGYLLTSNESYLKPYNDALANEAVTISTLKTLTLDYPNHKVRIDLLRQLIETKELELEQTIALHRSGNIAEALQIVTSNLGKITMDEIRAVTQEMQNEENILMEKRKSESHETVLSSVRVIYGGSFLTFVILTIVAFLTSRSIGREYQQLQAAQNALAISNQELQSFVYRTSHDFKSPLLGIKSMVGFIEEDIKLGNTEEALENITRINKNVESALAVVGSTLSLVKTDLADMTINRVSLINLSQDVISKFEGYAESRKVEIKIGENIADISIESDATHIRTIVENLVSNAIKYSNDQRDDSFVQIDAFTDIDSSVKITIVDNGVGIPEKYQSQVFGMFKQFHPEISNGTGLGLYIVQKSVDRLNGSITFDSSSDGTRFNIVIPRLHS